LNGYLENLEIRRYKASHEAQLIDLWKECNLVVPPNDPQRDIHNKLTFQPDSLYVGTVEDRLVASVMVGYEGHRGWINYLAVSPEFQRKGIGRRMMEFAEDAVIHLGCPKINLQVRTANKSVIAFYETIGFKKEDRVSLGKRLKP